MPDSPQIRTRKCEIAAARRRLGYRRIGLMQEHEGLTMNQKKLRRLYQEAFDSLVHARKVLARRHHDDNHHRPHSSLGGPTPAASRSLEQRAGSAPGTLAATQIMNHERLGLSK
ncbi:integrase core domain-containing protein [Maricaulis maris]|uniref:integrase core domain-containing protein n=1 Tax=Maricaulis maris TaxID=74318 RepID=UPI0011C49E4C|nr:integrase core domain-containing protein [Maricaulis maris]